MPTCGGDMHQPARGLMRCRGRVGILAPRRSRVGLLCMVVLLGACSGAEGDLDAVVVLAASSVAPSIEAIALDLGVPVAVSSGGSQVLVAQVRAGAPADVVVLADRALADDLHNAGLSSPVAFTTTGVSLVARTGLALGSVSELLETGSASVVLADEDVPLGLATREALDLLGIELPVDRVVSLEASAASLLAKVEAGAADLAIAYTANATQAAARGRLQVVGELAPGEVVTTTWIQSATPRGADLVAELLGPVGQRILAEHGFEVRQHTTASS